MHSMGGQRNEGKSEGQRKVREAEEGHRGKGRSEGQNKVIGPREGQLGTGECHGYKGRSYGQGSSEK